MCGRYTLTAKQEELARKFLADYLRQMEAESKRARPPSRNAKGAGADGKEGAGNVSSPDATEPGGVPSEPQFAEHPRYNIAPGQPIPVVLYDAQRELRRMDYFNWGLIPSWAQDINIGYKMINARAETIAEKPSYKIPFRRRRCLIPANGFYEWKREGSAKQPYYFTRSDGEPFAFAGIWDRWDSPDGSWILSCSLVTTAANRLMAPIHNRMPVILAEDDYEPWLDTRDETSTTLTRLNYRLRPREIPDMVRYPVSTAVNNARNDTPDLIRKIEQESEEPPKGFTGELFDNY